MTAEANDLALVSQQSDNLTLGILGGMGPLATVDFMQKVCLATNALVDQEHLKVVVISDPSIPDRSSFLLGESQLSPLPALIRNASKLEELCADFVAIPCNTAHHWFDTLQGALSIPILHIADSVCSALAARKKRNLAVAVMATRGTASSGFYSRRLSSEGFLVIEPSSEVEVLVEAAIRAAKKGQLDEAERLARSAFRELRQSAEIVILACTELPIVLKSEVSSGECVDATSCLANDVVLYARRKHRLNRL